MDCAAGLDIDRSVQRRWAEVTARPMNGVGVCEPVDETSVGAR
jgi:hypothetical protein